MTSLMGVMLDSLQHDAECLGYYAAQLDRHVTFMADDTMPSFRTAAEARLEDAELRLEEALIAVRKARAAIRPVDLRAPRFRVAS
jgi:hypothetical protein